MTHLVQDIAGQLTSPITSQDRIPTQDQMFGLVYKEIGKLRSCGMSRRDIVQHMETKELRKSFSSQISFWEGVLALMTEVSDIKTFG